jgi:hypothetical protein
LRLYDALWSPWAPRRKGVIRYTLPERKKRYRERHPDRVKAEADRRDRSYFVRYARQRYLSDDTYALMIRLRTRTYKALGRKKPETTMDLLGCSPADFRSWIEGQFLPGMGWHNRADWDLDHYRPFAAFDLTDPVQRAAVCHYTNIRPLWRRDNRAKGAAWL